MIHIESSDYILVDNNYTIIDTDIDSIKEYIGESISSIAKLSSDVKNIIQLYTLKDELGIKRLDEIITSYKEYNDIKEALESKALYLEYQPQYSLAGLELVGVEALIRHRQQGEIKYDPEKIICIAEDNALIDDIGRFVLKRACKQNKIWQLTSGKFIKVSVNISAIQMDSIEVLDDIKEALQESGLDPEWLIIEITETSFKKNLDSVIEVVNEINKLGVSVVIDDFGTKYSTLDMVHKLDISGIKIDKVFIDDLIDNQVIAEKIIEISKRLNVYTVAEGVETKCQLDKLNDIGCNIVQGFYTGKPQSPSKIWELLNRR